MFGIVFVTKFPNGKIYVGQTTHPNNMSYFGSGVLCSFAIKKYGKQNLKRFVLRKCYSLSELNHYERHFIARLKSQNKLKGYNIAEGDVLNGELNPAKLPSVKGKISKTVKKLHENPAFKASVIAPMRTPEACAKRIAAIQSPEFRENHSTIFKGMMVGDKNPMFGRKQSNLCKEGNRVRMKNLMENTMWCNDGISEMRVKIADGIPQGFVRGRVNKTNYK